jgi:NADH-quinone oxidoreductase subunit N
MLDLFIIKSLFAEIFLSFCILFQLVNSVFFVNNFKNNFPVINLELVGQLFFFLSCALLLILNNNLESFFYNSLFITTISNNYIKIFFLSVCLFSIVLLFKSFSIQKLNFFEYFSTILIIVFSLLLLIDSADLLSSYILIEIQALSFYILASFRKTSAFSTESGIKYFVLGSFISGIFLFGCSFIYGAFGTLNFNELSLLFSIQLGKEFSWLYTVLLVANCSIIFTLFFKISCFPFQFWAPDVYEGAPLTTTIIFSIFPKIPLFYFFIKWMSIISSFFMELEILFLFCGVVSVLFGAFWAIKQKRVKKLIIYSSIAQVGFLVVALSALELINLRSIYFFLFIYLTTSILIWSIFCNFYFFKSKTFLFEKKILSPIFISNLANFFKINKLWSFSFIIIFFSIAGIPPLSGFLAKIFVIISLISLNNYITGFILIIISSISVFYYLRIIKVTFFEIKTNSFKFDNSLVIFSNLSFNIECCLLALGLYFLVCFFFNPSSLILICYYLSLNLLFA